MGKVIFLAGMVFIFWIVALISYFKGLDSYWDGVINLPWIASFLYFIAGLGFLIALIMKLK